MPGKAHPTRESAPLLRARIPITGKIRVAAAGIFRAVGCGGARVARSAARAVRWAWDRTARTRADGDVFSPAIVLAAAMIALAAPGCAAMEFDAKIAALDERSAAYNEAFAAACDAFRAGVVADSIAAKHELQRQLIARDSEGWIRANTREDGTFAADAASIADFLARRDAAVELLASSRRGYAEAERKFADATAQFRATSQLVRERKAEYEEVRRSVQALATRVVDFVAGAATAAGTAAVVAP